MDAAVDVVEYANGNTTWAERDDCHKRLVNLPSADVVPVVHARWVDADFCGQYECSECGNNAVDLYDFCPNCGAKMEG